jgi:hypothetical protein
MPRTPLAVPAGAFLIAAALASPSRLLAQGSVTLTPPDAPRWDATLFTGWYGAARSGADTWNDWTDAGFGGGSISFGWTRRLRAEVDASFAGRGSVYASAPSIVPGQPFPAARPQQRRYQDTSLSASVLFDPLENRWVHPFIGGGVGIVREDLQIESPEWIYYGRPPGGIPLPAEPTLTDVTYRVALHVVGGARFYVAERAYLRTDLRIAMAGDQPSAQFRIGVGFDF